MRHAPTDDPVLAADEWFLHHGLTYFVPEERAAARSALRLRRILPFLVVVLVLASGAGGALAWTADQVSFAPATLLSLFLLAVCIMLLLAHFTEMPTHCEVCAVPLEPEPGFYWGAMFITYAFNVATVLLVVGSKGLAQTAAAVSEGCARFADGFAIAGAVANQVASERHAELLREGFARASVPLVGLVRRDPGVALPSP